MNGEEDQASCPDCGAEFARGSVGGRIRVTVPGEGSWEVPSPRLTAAISAQGGPESRARDAQGQLLYGARVQARRAEEEHPVWFKGELQGFAERLEAPVVGFLQIGEEGLTLLPPPDTAADEGDNPLGHWPFMSLGAVQTSSSSLQISPKEGGLVEFRFLGDSPRRWEDLLRSGLREAYRREGRGEIVEFQPRIVAE